MLFPKNDSVIAKAIASSYIKTYNDALYADTASVSIVKSINDRIRALGDDANALINLIASTAHTYATWGTASSYTISGENLIATSRAAVSVFRLRANQSVINTKAVWEVTFVTGAGDCTLGVVTTNTAVDGDGYLGIDAESWGLFTGAAGMYHNGAEYLTINGNAAIPDGTTVMFYLDTAAGTLGLKYGGADYPNVATGLPATMVPAINYQYNQVDVFTINTGQSAFVNSVPSGYPSGLFI